MAVELKSGASADLGTIDPTSKALRVTTYNTDGSVVDTKTPVAIAVNPVTVVNNDIVASFDASAYKYVSLQLTGTWVGTVSFQGSNNNGTFEDIVVQNTGIVLTPYVLSLTANGGVKIPVLFKYLRIRVTAYTSGTITGTAFGYKEDANTGQISTVGTVNIGSAQTLATVTNLAQLGGNAISMGSGVVGSGTQRVSLATDQLVGLAAGTNYVGDVKVLPTITATPIPLKVISAVGTNAALVKNSAANVNFILIVSQAATPRYLKFYNKATIPIVGVDSPTHVFPLAVGASPIQAPPKGFGFTNGFGYAITLGAADSDTTPFTVVGEVSIMLEYT